MSIYICLFLSYIFIYKTFTFFFKLLHVWESAAQGVAFFQACPLVKHPAFFKLCQRSAISEVVFFCFLSSPFSFLPQRSFGSTSSCFLSSTSSFTSLSSSCLGIASFSFWGSASFFFGGFSSSLSWRCFPEDL